MPKQYRYVGPASVLQGAATKAGVTPESASALAAWASMQDEWDGDEVAVTFVIMSDGTLRVAPRRSEHVACASAREVLSAGELLLRTAPALKVMEANNLSTGYCPEGSSWSALEAALDRLGVPHPGGFTATFEFRKCSQCGERSVIKDDSYFCELCGAQLSENWNLDVG